MATTGTALATSVPSHTESASLRWQEVLEVPCQVHAEIPVVGFSARDLLLLQAGSVVNSKQISRGKIGLQANGSFIAWAEFDVASGRLGVRITDLG